MGMPAEDRIDSGDTGGELQVHVHAVVRQQYDDPSPIRANCIDGSLQVLFANAESPVGHEVARMCDGRVGKGLADDGNAHAIHLAHHVAREYGIAKVCGAHILCDEGDLAIELLLDDLAHAVLAECKFPVRSHDVHAQQPGGVDHVLTLGPERGGRPLPRVTPIQQERIRSSRL